MALSRQSFGLTALAATSTLGAWIFYNYFCRRTKPNGTRKDGGSLDFIAKGTKDNLDSSESTCSLDSTELDQVLTSNGDVDLKIFRHILQQKEGRNLSNKTVLFSRLLTKMEHTLAERDRIEQKLENMRNTRRDKDVATPEISKVPTTSAAKISPAIQPHSDTSVCMVIQRFRGANLVCNETECVEVGAKIGLSLKERNSSESICGLMVYVSFAKGCTQQATQAAAKIVINLPILTMGAWGDGVSKTLNVIDLAKQQPNAASIVIVPQANLINKVCPTAD